MKNALLIPLVALVATACTPKEPGFVVEGEILGAERVFLSKITPERMEPLDTIFVSDGSFYLEYPTTAGEIYILEPENGNPIPLVPAVGERIAIKANAADYYNRYSISGSPESERTARLMRWSSNSREALDTLDASIEAQLETDPEACENNRASLDSTFTRVVLAHKDSLKRFILEDTTSLANIRAFSQNLGQIQLITVSEDFDLFLKADRGLQARYPASIHAVAFHERIERIKQQLQQTRTFQEARERNAPGNFATNISLPDTAGNLRSLNELLGQVVLIDFWASWCKPCRVQNPLLIKLYDRYHGKGFEIFSVSLDGTPQQPNGKAAWLAAIAQDGLNWKWHVSDLKGGASQAAVDYGVTSIPYNVLVDRQGRVVATNIRVEDLPAAIERALKTKVPGA